MSKRRLRVPVTTEDIRNGNPQEADACPLYLAIKRAADLADWPIFPAWVDGFFVGAEDDGGRQVLLDLPQKAAEFAERFDRTGRGKKFTFYLVLDED